MDDKKVQKGKKKRKIRFSTFIIIFFLAILLVAYLIPNFLRYAAWAVGSEAKQNLGAIFTAYTSYHNNNGTYPSSPFIQIGSTEYNCLAVSDWEPKGTIRYNYKCMDTIAFSPQENKYPGCTGCPTDKIYTHADQTSFTAAACANIESEKFCDAWTIDDSKNLRHVSDGYTHNKKFKVKDFIRHHLTRSTRIMKFVDYLFSIGTRK